MYLEKGVCSGRLRIVTPGKAMRKRSLVAVPESSEKIYKTNS
jgi:hypothetical protein